MKAFEFAAPASEQEALELLSEDRGATEVLAGGTDVVPLMQKLLVTPDRVVSLGNVASLRQIDVDSHGARLGAMATLDELLNHEVSSLYPRWARPWPTSAARNCDRRARWGASCASDPSAGTSATGTDCWPSEARPWSKETIATTPSWATKDQPSLFLPRAWHPRSSQWAPWPASSARLPKTKP